MNHLTFDNPSPGCLSPWGEGCEHVITITDITSQLSGLWLETNAQVSTEKKKNNEIL